MKSATVEVWGQVFGQDVKVDTLVGTKTELADKIGSMLPAQVRDQISIQNTLNSAVWSHTVEWLGNHTMGLRVLKVSMEASMGEA